MLTFFSISFVGSGAASSALPRLRELLWEFLYKRTAMNDRRATRRMPNELPTPIPIFAGRPRFGADADTDVEAGMEADVDVETVEAVI